MSAFTDNMIAAAPALGTCFGETWTRYQITREHERGGYREIRDAGTTLTAWRDELSAETTLHTTTPDAVAPGDIVVSPENEEYRVLRVADEARTAWAIQSTEKPRVK
jgi:hypothetical protein